MDLPPSLRDTHTIIAKHSASAHYGCVALRCFLGLCIVLWWNHEPICIHSKFKDFKSKYVCVLQMITISLMILGVVFFSYKHAIVGRSWKVYPRTIAVLVMAIVLLYRKEPTVAGTLLIVDALMGLQSRHTMAVLAPLLNTPTN